MTRPGLLLIDDDPLISESLAFVLKDIFLVTILASREEARKRLQIMPVIPNLALVDLGLPPNPHKPNEGFAMVTELLNINPNIKILILSGQDSDKNVRHALSLGAIDFIPKPCDIELLKTRLKHQVMISKAETNQPQAVKSQTGLIGKSPAMASLRDQVRQFANSPFSVLVMGDSGSGKELVAQSLHTESQRKKAPCLTVNCAAFTAELLDAQLFGYSKGAYTGATTAKSGFFEDADTGSLILDEIGEMALELQAKLLRVLENGEYYRLGETKVRKSTARIIAATNRDLRKEVRQGNFRADLYHRLSILTVQVPPLSDRADDKSLLLKHFQTFYADMGGAFQLDETAKHCWKNYSFPGNVRELRNIVIRLGARYPNQEITQATLAAELDNDYFDETDDDSATSNTDITENINQQLEQGQFSLDEKLLEWESLYIDSALDLSAQNLSQAARLLGINRTTLYSKMQRLRKTTTDK